jgi:hypothetical protein
MRMLSCAQVTNPRAVGSWLSYDDFGRLVKQVFLLFMVSLTMTERWLIIQLLNTLCFVQKIMPRNLPKRSF